MSDGHEPRAQFHDMLDGTQEDWAAIMSHLVPYSKNGGARVLEHLKLLDGDCGGFAIDRLQHCLQTATRAHRDGRAEDYVVMALLHDIGDTLGAYNHPDIAAAIIKPFVSEELLWITQHHGIFQGYNFFHYLVLTATCGRSSRKMHMRRRVRSLSINMIARHLTPITTPRRSAFLSQW